MLVIMTVNGSITQKQPGQPQLEREMKTKSLVYVEHDICRDPADQLADALDSHAPDLLGLSFRILLEASCRCRQQHLKWIHTLDV